MKYVDKENLFFVHIPKCAGTDVGKAMGVAARYPFEEMAADIGIPLASLDPARCLHPTLGMIAPTHIPLPFLEAHFPRVWALLSGATSFALVREPRARFISALTQRLMEFKGTGAIRLDDDLVQREAAEVCEWLDARNSFCDLEYVHFTRQADYTILNGEPRVDHVFPLERIDAMAAWLAREQRFPIKVTRHHARHQPRKWFTGLQPAVRLLARSGLPKPFREAIYPLWMKSGLFAPASEQYDKLALASDVEAFIPRYYAADMVLYGQAQERMRALPPFGGGGR